jgi:putative ABC transport system permease protein
MARTSRLLVLAVAWAVPLYTSVHSAKLSDGNFKSILLVGLDNSTLVGRPGVIIAGKLEDMRLPNSVIIDELAVQRLSAGRSKPLGLGDSFEINDKEARIVGICQAERHFFG